MAKRGRPRHPDILTPREWDVLALVREGLTNEQIAERLEVAERTARFHVSEILRKLGVSSRHEAALWTPEERRPWWSFAIAPLSFGGAHRWLATAAASATIAVGVAAVGLLVWGISRTDGDGDSVSAVAPTATMEVAPESSVLWTLATNTKVSATNQGTCGDGPAAIQYGLPEQLAVDGYVPSGDARHVLLGLDPEPYPYLEAQVSAPRGIGRQPSGWELHARPPLLLGMTSVPQGAWIGPTELFLRRLDQPRLLFRYATENCEQADNFSPLWLADLEPEEVLELPPQLPAILEREEGDYISAQEAIAIAEREEARALAGLGSSQPAGNNLKGERVVWAELAESDELSIPISYSPRDVLWLIVFELGDTAGPLRPGNILGRYYRIYAESGTVQSYGVCCVRLEFND